ncbi:MAG: 4-hydroxy-tetrahydrodipicolinate reductase [Spirochaetaceae bacterium]|nr:4-hydroxy-tetrahydrodipicolinate reductase [Spirochaetaceae bacterium]
MRIAIVGYGRMGHEVEQALMARGHTISAIVEPTSMTGAPADVYGEVSGRSLAGCNVAIEFSLGEAVVSNAKAYAETGCPAVVGTTGWQHQLDEVRAAVETSEIGFVYGSNFSIGAHIFFAVSRYAASLVRNIEDYDLLIHEMHHKQKKDSPSGTALTLAQSVLDVVPRKRRIETGRLDRAPEPDELHVSSSRVGSVPGTHTLIMDSAADTIEVRHQARSRGGFALGAVLAAEWIIGKSGLYSVESFVQALLHEDQGE